MPEELRLEPAEVGRETTRWCDVEFRYDPETRVTTGVAMVYGDVAEFPWGERERFAAGAFYDLGDTILDLQHDRARPLARVGGGDNTGAGKLILTDSPTKLSLEAKLPNTRDADDAIELIRTRVLRGYSVTFIPEVIERDEKLNMTTIKRARLPRIGLVDKPAYAQAKVDVRSKQEDDTVTPEQVRELIDEALKNAKDGKVNTAALARSITEAVGESVTTQVAEQVREQIEAAMKERDEAAAAAEAEREAAEKAKADAEKAESEANERAEARADLLTLVRDLLPEDTETRGMSNHEILVAAAGDEIEDASERSEDYLRAKIEGIVERRAEAEKASGKPVKRGAPSTGSAGAGVISVLDMPRSTKN